MERVAILFFVTTSLTSCTGASAPGPRLELPPELAGASGVAGPEVKPDGAGFHSAAFPIFGTRCELTLGAPDREAATDAVDAALAELRRIDALMSEWRSDSEISRVNAAAGLHPVRVSDEVLELVSLALDAAAHSSGAFDPSWAGMRGVWRFGDAMDGEVPADAAIEDARRRVDWRKVRVDRDAGTVYLEEAGMALGLGGIAKGWAVDRLAANLRQAGIRDFVIKLGGELYAAGRRGGHAWTAGVLDPRDPGSVVATLEIEDRAFSTSGDYERYFVKDGVRYHHVIDPATGRPATASRSVTALCPDATTAEIVTKPVFIKGPGEGIPYGASLGCVVVVIDAAGELHVSGGLAGRLQLAE
ncbi:MAG TPA: FAD:protein FMN transferase [Vulgatibacter sp.]